MRYLLCSAGGSRAFSMVLGAEVHLGAAWLPMDTIDFGPRRLVPTNAALR